MKSKLLTAPIKPLLIILLTVPYLTGCWDSLELDKRAVILGISVDKATDKTTSKESETSHLRGKFPAPEKELIRVTAQIALPGQIPLGPGEGGGSTVRGQTVWPIEVVGHTIDDALMNLQQQISSRLFFGHLRVIVVSEAIARSGLQDLNDYLRRNPEIRRTTWMLISKGDAANFMIATPRLGRLPTLYLLNTIDQATKMGKFPNDFLGIFWSNASKMGQEGYLPYIELEKKENVGISGIAYFKADKMVGVSKPLEIAAYMGIKGMNPAGYRSFVKVDGLSGTFNLYATRRQSRIRVSQENGRPTIDIQSFIEVNLEEKLNESVLVSSPDVLRKIEQADEKDAKKFYSDVIRQTQQYGTDVFGFGEYVRAKQPKYWREHVQTKEKWQEMYKDLSVHVDVTIKIRRIGMKAQ
ncbi:Ger(x)C family spore germination protein [Paenibacillus thalictri]|uniref:Ger(X)C family spore germination protein n=1 Tax=Paenibacillus thalictri TaxID=2527873 RepID=A0A4Q9E2H1_9BACL|nr:Ger(x)C family spore germination protein [Paenibacillus thalictri]TBL81841.1 Ger(x)C family spore germination protein [Paenibacillus thalictri]